MGKNNKVLNLQDIVGTKVRMLTVLVFSHIEKAEHADRLRNKYMYKCLCDCGNETIVNRFHLKQSDSASSTWSCGCYQKAQSLKGHEKQKGKPRPHVQKPNGASILNTHLAYYKKAAIERNFTFLLTDDEFEELTKQNCHYCNVEPRLFKKKDCFTTRSMNGVDRVDSTKGYTATNCVPACTTCNLMKLDHSQKEFLTHIKKILKHQESLSQKEVFLLTGAPGSGKTWILSQLSNFSTIDSDVVTPAKYAVEIRTKPNPILTLTIGVSTFIKNNPDLKVKLIVIQESQEVVEKRILKRGGVITATLAKRIKRMERLAKQAEFAGSSDQVLEYLNSVTKK